MKNLLIIGARGFGREIYYLAMRSNGYQKDYEIKGFLDDKKDALDGFNNYPPIIDSVENYIVNDDDVFVCALGDVQARKKYITIILNKGGEFINLIHPSAICSTNITSAKGCIIAPFVSLGADAIVGDFTLIQTGAIVGHDVTIGNWSRLDSYVVLVGGVTIGSKVCVYTGAIINRDVIIHDNACVGAGSFVIRDVKEGTTVFGNPAKIL
jgi:sugar O-acyltransferase (sialic acid O-acetyltransferase NeuD family)